MKKNLNSLEETEAFALNLGKTLHNKPTLIALYGDLGAGKTTFVRAMCQSVLPSTYGISSPTFTYLNIYADLPAFPIYHFDLYRLHSWEEFQTAGFEEYLNTPSWCFIEWPDRISAFLPKNTVRIHLTHQGEHQRSITVERPW